MVISSHLIPPAKYFSPKNFSHRKVGNYVVQCFKLSRRLGKKSRLQSKRAFLFCLGIYTVCGLEDSFDFVADPKEERKSSFNQDVIRMTYLESFRLREEQGGGKHLCLWRWGQYTTVVM